MQVEDLKTYLIEEGPRPTQINKKVMEKQFIVIVFGLIIVFIIFLLTTKEEDGWDWRQGRLGGC